MSPAARTIINVVCLVVGTAAVYLTWGVAPAVAACAFALYLKLPEGV